MNRPPARTALWVACAALASSRPPPAPAQEKKKDEDKGPRVTMVSPLAVAPGAAATLKVRGLRLAEATEVRSPEANPAVKAVIKSKGKAEMSQGREAAWRARGRRRHAGRGDQAVRIGSQSHQIPGT